MTADPSDWILAALVTLAWAALTLRIALRHRGGAGGSLLIGYASQSGFAEMLARAQAAETGATILPLDRIGPAELAGARRALFYVSTTGEGDPPDNAAAFARMMARAQRLTHLSYGFLALGDRSYPHFCGFGRRVEDWLRACGAQPLFPRVELDRDHPEALALWQRGLDRLGLHAAEGPGHAPWRLVSRRHLNPGSPGAPLWHLVLKPQGDLPAWRAGDIAGIAIPRPEGELIREYSLASLPSSGRAELILREVPGGAGSPLLCRLEPGGEVRLRIRANSGFHVDDDQAPLVLIGNGSGLAGLLSHLRHRAGLTRAGRVWLIHGERAARSDAIFDAELHDLAERGVLTRLDRVFSRDGGPLRYVQEVVRAQAGMLRREVADGAVICLCGRREGMAQDVLAALEAVLGTEGLERLRSNGRLKQDVY
ncbi:NADPH cytochrome P450 oxidoreductase family protein [Pseudogemmobacter humi]|uniref:NADPH--hemoprotein reductase n=1 Tax=Pseudogemmobacter humi TaxID=2483812 RepID=A0A3P5XMU0_9RHOB|nr:NADPH cytochrome P450 oxidoreductase family protein [Pseudogemmobacter humi]VDC30000.1 Sulfite reductase [NADPH] flavoprotein alpha-component [Pseudogemmobacter humi]